MRYYGTGDKIYIFGFSRGAFTARFVARMIAHVGLLSMGNEEMVPFAYKVYQDYEMGKDPEGKYMKLFRRTFCRHGHEHAEAEEAESSGKNGTTPAADCAEDDDDADAQGGVKVHFLGLFDTVNSVGTFDTPFGPTTKPAEVAGTAHHVRHAVAIDERRVKFKAALLAQDKQKGAPPQTDHDDGSDDEDSETSALMPHGHTAHAPMKEDIREVWFPGNHGDIGGGWPADNEAQEPGMWASFKKIFFKAENPKKDDSVHLDKTDDWFQLSDVPLRWMVAELEAVEAAEAASNKADKSPGVTWNVKNKNDFFDRFNKKRHWAITGRMHDTMRVGGGSDFGKVLLWKFMGMRPSILQFFPDLTILLSHCLFPFPAHPRHGYIFANHLSPRAAEVFPLIRRWEYFADKAEQWQYVRFPLNMGGCRDIPPGALFHHAVLDRMAHFPPGITTMQVTNKDGAIENKTVKPYLPHNDANVRSEGRVLRPRPLRVAGVPPSEITDPAVNVKKDRPAKAGEPYFVWSESNTLGGKSAAVTDRVYRLRCD